MMKAMDVKRLLPPVLHGPARRGWYALKNVRYFKYYAYGLAFDLLEKDYRTEGMVFRIPKDLTTRNHRARFWFDTHELEERILVKKYIPSDACVLELGACLGVVSAVINKCLANPRNHVAVEANPQLIPVLQQNRDINGCAFAIESGMVSKTSDGTFYLDDCIVVSGPVQESARRITVPVFSMEELMQRNGLSFDTLFMDIQGGELSLIDEHPDVLARLKLVILEVHPHLIGAAAVMKCRDLLAQAGLHKVESSGLIEVWKRKLAEEGA